MAFGLSREEAQTLQNVFNLSREQVQLLQGVSKEQGQLLQGVSKKCSDLEDNLLGLLKCAMESEQKMIADKLKEVKETVQEVIALCGRLEQRNNELNAAGIVAGLRDRRLSEAEDGNRKITIDLAKREEQTKNKEKELKQREEGLNIRESGLVEREKALGEQIIEVSKRETCIKEKETSIEIAAEEELQKRLREFSEKQKNTAADFTKKLDAYASSIAANTDSLPEIMNNIFENMRLTFLNELEDVKKSRNEAYCQLNKDIESERKSRLKDIEDECNRRLEAVRKEREDLEKEREEFADKKEQLRQAQLGIEREKADIDSRKAALDWEKGSFENSKNDLKDRMNNIDDTVDRLVTEKYADLEIKNKSLNERYEYLQGKYKEACDELNKYNSYVTESGGQSPSAVLEERNKLKHECEKLRYERDSRPDQKVLDELRETEEKLKTAREERDSALKAREELLEQNGRVNEFKLEIANFERIKKVLEKTQEELINENERLHRQIERLNAAEVKLVDREKRVAEIKSGCDELLDVQNPLSLDGQPKDDAEGERIWLEEIAKNLEKYNFYVSRRLLYAFHTALKISDWSIITVLAGVSGTGKSKLPQLYAKMGRLNFISVPVQPNWDSQESMLGYFNSIDNRFVSEPVLRFLAQTAEGLHYCVNIVLLDEMNLAHVEYYFADFLSKLETRRDLPDGKEPAVEVKLGAGVEAFNLPLCRSTLWVGTMNQDETTKSLSDKVLDRGLVINFPRPKRLRESAGLMKLDKFLLENGIAAKPMLHYDVWRSWIKEDTGYLSCEQKKELDKYKNILEEINTSLGPIGRALGHRVWQSVEMYIANHPDVITAQAKAQGDVNDSLKKAIKTAFEDQLVQKVMPKLRGIETRGKGKVCLDSIGNLLSEREYTIYNDFLTAREAGYGQFIWNSADYLEDTNDNKRGEPDEKPR